MLNNGTTPILPEAEMRALGFTDHNPEHWYFTGRVAHETTLNITIDKATGVYEEYVLDEHFGQPVFYGRMKEPYRTQTHDAIEEHLTRLNAAGLELRVDHAEYGYEEVTA